MGEIIASRQFAPLYILLDIAFLIILLALLLYKKQYMTIAVGLIMGVVYMIVDYGIFHLICHSRSINEGYSLFWVLLWMSMSYGFTNFAWIWLCLSKNKYIKEFTILIMGWWICAPLITKSFASNASMITIQRTTGEYHGYMALILFVGYLGVIIYNLYQKHDKRRINILRLLIIGILVQFGWEMGLLLGGIRSVGFTSIEAIKTLVINSLLETNLGMPYVYLIFIWITSKYNQQFKHIDLKLSLVERIEEDNAK